MLHFLNAMFHTDGTRWADGRAKVAQDCRISKVNSFVLRSRRPRFRADDIGKQIVIYGQGNFSGGYRQPLITVIEDVLHSRAIRLKDSAYFLGKKSSRVVYGRDDTQNLQDALDQIAAAILVSGGQDEGLLYIPRGHYLTRHLVFYNGLPSFGVAATGLYNNIRLQGCGMGASILENWDVDSDNLYPGVIALGYNADINQLNHASVSNITIADLTVRQVHFASNIIHSIIDESSNNVTVVGCEIVSGSYEGIKSGGFGHSQNWSVRGCKLHHCGLGGPGNSDRLSALNLCGTNIVAEANVIHWSGQCAEISSRNLQMRHNRFYSPPDGGGIGINLGNSQDATFENYIHDNLFVGFTSPIQTASNSGALRDTIIRNNRFIECGAIQIQSGLEGSPNVIIAPDPIIHGNSEIVGNMLIRTVPQLGNPGATAIWLGSNGSTSAESAQFGLESVRVENNVSILSDQLANKTFPFLTVFGAYGGGDPWQPGTAYVDNGQNYSSLVVPTGANGFYYRCVAAGMSNPDPAHEPVWPMVINETVPEEGGLTWVCARQRPYLIVESNYVFAAPGITSLGSDVDIVDDVTFEILSPAPIGATNVVGNIVLVVRSAAGTMNIPAM